MKKQTERQPASRSVKFDADTLTTNDSKDQDTREELHNASKEQLSYPGLLKGETAEAWRDYTVDAQMVLFDLRRAINWLYELQHRSRNALRDLLWDVSCGHAPTGDEDEDEEWEPASRLNELSLELHDVAGVLANIDNKLRGLPSAAETLHQAL
jgi:hypothetical protein